jgi:hypothetical protein
MRNTSTTTTTNKQGATTMIYYELSIRFDGKEHFLDLNLSSPKQIQKLANLYDQSKDPNKIIDVYEVKKGSSMPFDSSHYLYQKIWDDDKAELNRKLFISFLSTHNNNQ